MALLKDAFIKQWISSMPCKLLAHVTDHVLPWMPEVF